MDLSQHSCAIPNLLDFEGTSACSEIFFSSNAPQEQVEFEFQMSSSFHLEEVTPTPADELFHNGKILPFQHKQAHKSSSAADNTYMHLLPISFCAPCSNTTSPLQSCQATPFQSCRQTNDLKFDDCFIDCEISDVIVIGTWPQKSCSTNSTRRFLGQKLRASREFIKTMFQKKPLISSLCSLKPACYTKPRKVRKLKDTKTTNFSYTPRKHPFTLIRKERHSTSRCEATQASNIKEKDIPRDSLTESRRSLSGAIHRLSRNKRTSVSPTYGSASASILLQSRSLLIPEQEKSIDEAILHCKQSHLRQMQ